MFESCRAHHGVNNHSYTPTLPFALDCPASFPTPPGRFGNDVSGLGIALHERSLNTASGVFAISVSQVGGVCLKLAVAHVRRSGTRRTALDARASQSRRYR